MTNYLQIQQDIILSPKGNDAYYVSSIKIENAADPPLDIEKIELLDDGVYIYGKRREKALLYEGIDIIKCTDIIDLNIKEYKTKGPYSNNKYFLIIEGKLYNQKACICVNVSIEFNRIESAVKIYEYIKLRYSIFADETEKSDMLRRIDEDNFIVTDIFPIGKYLSGLPNAPSSGHNVYCRVTKDYFYIIRFKREDVDSVSTINERELECINRNSVVHVFVDKKNQIRNRITVTRLLALGVFALAFPKAEGENTYCMLIDFNDNNGLRHNAIFEFSTIHLANNAHNKLSGFVTAKNKVCPFCAETIKLDAIKCRFCGSML